MEGGREREGRERQTDELKKRERGMEGGRGREEGGREGEEREGRERQTDELKKRERGMEGGREGRERHTHRQREMS